MINTIKEQLASAYTRLHLLILLLGALLAATPDPLGFHTTQSYGLRLLYWLLVVECSILIARMARRWAHRRVGSESPIRHDLLMVAMMVVFFTPVLWGLTHGILLDEPGPDPSMHALAFYVTAVTLAICVARRVLPGFEQVKQQDPQLPASADQPMLLRRLPCTFQGPILRLSARDHFVDVVSAAGVESIRMRFADAVNEMDTVTGYCTHRSHWVTRAAIAGVERKDGKVFIRLTNNDLVPISRKYRPDLEEAGLL